MVRTLGLLTAALILVFSGVVHGLWTNRWAEPEELRAAVARLETVPMTLGDWDGQPMPMDARERQAAGGSGYLVRRYVNRRTGSVVSLLIVCGPSGPVSVHTPDVCYEGAGYQRVGAVVKHSLPTAALRQPAEFWLARFRQEGAAVPGYRRIFWSWSTGKAWRAADKPRFAFAHFPVLHKLYVTRRMVQPQEPVELDPCLDFLNLLLPELQNRLFGGS